MLRKKKAVSASFTALSAVLVAVAPGAVAGAGPAGGDDVTPQIIGGHEAVGNTDWMVSLQYDAPAHDRYDWHTCGGVLAVARDAVITAAHCVTDPPPAAEDNPARWHMDAQSLAIPVKDKAFKVRIGSKDRTTGVVVVPVTSITVREGWDWTGPEDLAVLTLDHSVQVQQLQLGGTSATPGERVDLFGWGRDHPDSESEPLPNRLQQLETSVIPSARCAGAAITPMDICVDNPFGTDGVCYGDSGGPAIRYTRDGVPQLVGVVSRMELYYCGTSPAVFTSAPKYRTWIYDVIRGVPAPGTVTIPVKTTPPPPVP